MDDEEAAAYRIQALIVQFRTGSPLERRYAAEALTQISDLAIVLPSDPVSSVPSSLSEVTALIQTLEDKSASRLTRQGATKALGLMGNSQAVPALSAVLKDKDTDSLIRDEIVRTLGSIGDAPAILALTEAFKDENMAWSVRGAASRTLVQAGLSAVPALSAVLKDKNGNYKARYDAAETLGAIGDPQAVPALSAVLRDKHRYVGQKAATALKEIAQRRPDPVLRIALPALRRLQKRNSAFQEALEQIEVATAEFRNLPVPASAPPLDARLLPRPAAVPSDRRMTALIAGLKEGDPSRRYFAAEALRAMRDPYAVPALIETLNDKKEYRPIRGEAARALGAIGGSQSILALIDPLKDKKRGVSRQAARALKEIAQHHPDPALRAALPLLRRLRERDPAFREALEQIEAVTGAFKDLPMPASAPPPDARTLPRPAAMSSHTSAPMPHGWWLRLRRALKGS